MPSIFAYQSSEVDWCEPNFQYSQLVAEFYNTFSNVTFLVFGPLMTFLMHPYIQKRSRYIYVLFILFTITGLFSMYFHMTLSFLGQMLDEIAILWLLASGYSIWLPCCYFPTFLGQNRSWYISLIVTITLVSTCLSFLKPTINAYALNTIGLHIVYIVVQEYKKLRGSCKNSTESCVPFTQILPTSPRGSILCNYMTKNKELRHLIEVSTVIWALAITSWISDRLFCSFWQWINFPYLHGIWHVLISFTFPYGMVILALVDSTYEMPDQTIKVRYWPRDTWPVGLPYVELGDDHKSC
ncbi:alkaline ceramidase 1 isoform X2 [Odocoileus virginianus]|uniref:Alkaline ceramidase n=1 Tax=Odocoileus virginianus TaxID=9874 RepID=A0A6J0ZEJ5_ODOVR|nr:alkaline ceramidase 1 isoform X1 [Odocoileus virginianus texanus]